MKALVAGWFSFKQGHATTGDLLSGKLVGEWLEQAGWQYDIAFDPPFSGGVNWRVVDPNNYSHIVFVCGPFQQGELEAEFFARFAGCRLIGLSLTMLVPLEKWQPFDFLIERDSSRDAHADLVFLTAQPKVPVVGVCLVEPYPGAVDELANQAIYRLLNDREAAIVHIDTRLDTNSTGLRTAAEIESLIANVDVLITTRLHGMVMALKNGVPVVAIDPEAGGAKIKRQAELIGWPAIFVADQLEDQALNAAFDYCLTDEARHQAKNCYEKAIANVEDSRERLIAALNGAVELESSFAHRNQQLVSVIIPCYKQAHYLGEAIESVLTQTYSHYEIIVVDDGSPDNTAEVAARYPVRYIWQENQGLSGARNTGIRASQGQYLVFLDADDRLTPNALRAGLNCFHTYPEAAFVSGHHRYIKGDGSLLNEYPPEPIDDDHYMALLKRNYIGMHATVMYQRSVFDTVGLFDTSLKSCEDYDLYLRIASKLPIHRHHEITAEYRWHDANMTNNSRRMLTSALTALRSQWEYVQHKPQYVQAYRAGNRFWRNYFGQQLLNRVGKSFSTGQWQQGFNETGFLLRYFPLWLSSAFR
ncbi:MAG: hypothetical protein Kow00121_18270 [Elainellaceae cyanobacterium]